MTADFVHFHDVVKRQVPRCEANRLTAYLSAQPDGT